MSEPKPNYTSKARTIFRINKDKENPFVMIDRRPIENPSLSWGSKGILAYLLSRPDNWTVRLQDLVKRAPDGVYKIRGYIKELVNAGHIKRVAQRDEVTKRIREYTLEVYELPFTNLPTNLPQAGLPQAANHTHNNTDSVNEKDVNNGTDVPSTAGLPFDWQVAHGQEVTQQDQFAAQVRDAANLMDMGCAGAGALALTFMTTRRIIIPEDKIKGNRKAAREMLQMHVKPQHVRQATLDLIEKQMTITDLFSVSKTAIALANPAKPESIAPVTVDADGFPETY
jgi:hypothetical protein